MTSRGKPAPGMSIETPESRRKFRTRLLDWFDANQRSLPWRAPNPKAYRVWVSEIMLQQTRVAVVTDYYKRFLRQFPTVKSLARADEQEVLGAWSGLGYYRRARMLHSAAKQIVAERGGKFPETSLGLRELPGIGRYTAAAIASIAFSEATAVVDGNVERVIDRLLGSSHDGKTAAKTTNDHWKIAQELLHTSRPGDFNQAMMELGALVCLPRNPQCRACPVAKWCYTRGDVRGLQVKSRRAGTLSYSLSLRANKVALMQRPKDARLMAGMWELPPKAAYRQAKKEPELFKLRHSITDTDYRVSVFAGASLAGCCWVSVSDLNGMALTGLTRKILQRAGILNIKGLTRSRHHSRRNNINAGT